MRRIAVVLTENIQPFHLSIVPMIFADVHLGELRSEVVFCAENPGPVKASFSMTATASAGLEILTQVSLVVVPFWDNPQKVPTPELSAALRRAHEAGIPIAGFCRGSFVLGHAGLLDGRRAATHWFDAVVFRKLFPKSRLDTHALYVEDGNVITSAGVAAGIDCCLHLLRRFEGAAVANEVARRMVIAPFREGGQAQFIAQPVAQRTSDMRINAVIECMTQNLAMERSIEELAERAAMSPRTFYRTFQKATGLTPHKWLLAMRLKRAQELLESSNESVERIAALCGFDSPVTFRQRFKEMFEVSPSHWRETFRAR